MDSLIEESWQLYHDAKDPTPVVRPSLPILFFGDSRRYTRSPLKIVTVGLNPSLAEFPVGDPFKRFRQGQDVYPRILGGNLYAEYLAALNDYFRGDPYWRWFQSFEPLLNGMGASYRDGQPNTALHTDLCSPLATSPTWSGLTANDRSILGPAGMRLWLSLVRRLAPDVVLVSVARHYLDSFDFPALGPWETLHSVERTRPYVIKAQEVEVVPNKKTLIVFGQASQTPFGSVSNVVKTEIGRWVALHVSGW